MQWLMSVYALVEAVVIPMNAFLLGRFSTRSLFVGSFVMFAIGSGIIAAGPTFAWLIVGRILQAFATGVAITMATTLVLITVPRASRGRMMGLLGLVISFAPAIGAPASGGLVDIVGWRVLLVGVTVLGFALAAIGAAFIRNHESFERTSFDVFSIVVLTAGMVGFLYGVSTVTEADMPWVSVLILVAGIGLLVVFARRQSTLEVPMLRLETLRTRQFRNAVILCCLMEAALLSIDVLLPLLVENSPGATPTVTGFVMMPAALVGAAFGTASIVSLTALAPGIDGYRLGFIGCAALLAAVAAMVLVSIRDR